MPTGLVLGGSFAQPNTPLGDGAFGSRDVDFYQFTAPAGSTLKAITSLPAGGTAMDTVLRLFDSAGTPLAVNDDFSGLYSRLDYTFTTAGTYYVGVSGAANAGYNPTSGGSGVAGSTGDYRLDLSLDIGDTLGTATVTGLAGTGSFAQAAARIGDGHFDSSDVDLYQFSAAANSVLMAVTSQPAGGVAMDTFLRLFDSAGAPLAAENNSPPVLSPALRLPDRGHLLRRRLRRRQRRLRPERPAAAALAGSTGDYRLDLTLTAALRRRVRAEHAAGGQRRRLARLCRLGNCQPGCSRRAAQVSARGRHQWGRHRRLPSLGPQQCVESTAVRPTSSSAGRAASPPNWISTCSTARPDTCINGVQAGDTLGYAGGGAGDLNHDGVPDLVLGRTRIADPNDLAKAGQIYVLFGGITNLVALDSADGTPDGRINLAALDGTHGFTINGTAANAYAGMRDRCGGRCQRRRRR